MNNCLDFVVKDKKLPLTQCKCNAGGHGVPAFSLCSTTANPSLTDDGIKMMFNKKPDWLSGNLTMNRFKFPHSTCTNRYVPFNEKLLF